MQLSVERHLLQNLAAIRLKRGAEVVNVHAADFGHQPVGATRWNAAEPEIIDAAPAPATDNVVAVGNLLQKKRDIGRIVLQIAVHGDNVFAAGMIETGGKSRCLAKISAQFDNRHAAVHSSNFA